MAVLALRKAWRLCGIIFPLVYYFSDKITLLFVILPILCIFILIEIARLILVRFNERLFSVFGKYLLVEKEKKGLLSTTWLLLSVFLSVILFSKEVAITASLFLIFGDAASGIMGTYFGRTRIGRRSLEGSTAFLITCLIVGIIARFSKLNLSWPIIICGSLTATITELLPIPVDDNFTIAIFSGIMMTLVSKVIG